MPIAFLLARAAERHILQNGDVVIDLHCGAGELFIFLVADGIEDLNLNDDVSGHELD